MRTIVPFLAAILFCLSAQATTFFVDPAKGDDANIGEAADKPWKSLARINALHLSPGDRIELTPGRYDLSLHISGTGTAEKPIIVRFAPGEYDFFPAQALKRQLHISNANDDPHGQKAIALAFDGAKHVRVEGGSADGKTRSDVFVHGQMIQTLFDHAQDIQLSGMAFDYRRPTMSEYTVVETAVDHADLVVHPDSAYEIKDGRLTWVGEGWTLGADSGIVQQYEPSNTSTWRCGNPYGGVSRVEELSPFRLRVFFNGNPGFTRGRTFQARDPFRNCSGSFARNSRDITWKNCAYYYMHGLGLVNQFCENLTLDHCWMAPRPGGGRTCTAWGDCFHLSGIKGKVIVDGTRFFGQHDDPINIHGTFLRVVEKMPGNKVRVRFMHNQTYGFEAFFPGDEVALVRGASLKELSRNKVVAAEMNGEKDMIVTLENPLLETPGSNDVLENISWNPDVTIRNCFSASSPTFGFVLKSRGPILVENCEFRGIHMSAIALAQYVDAFWYESCTVHDVVIRNNKFIGCYETPVIVNPGNGTDEGPVNENVRIENNYFEDITPTAVMAKSVKGVTIVNNRFATPTMPAIQTPWSSDVKIEDNLLVDKKAPQP